MICSVFAETQDEKIHLGHTCTAQSKIVCGSTEIPPGTRGVIKDARARIESMRFSVLWDGQTHAIWCSETEVIECVPKGPA